MPQSKENRPIDDPELLLSLYRISHVSSSAFNAREAFQTIMEEVQRLFHPLSASIALISPDSGLLEKEFTLGYPANTEELALHLGKGISGRVAFRGKAIYSGNVLQDSRYVQLIENVRSKIAAPMISGGQIAGVIDVDSDKINQYSDNDVQRLQAIADEAIRSLQAIWRQRQLINQSDQLNALFEVGQNVVSNLELQGLWDSITESALDLTGSRMATIQLFDEEKNQVSLQSVKPPSPEYRSRIEVLQLEESMNSPAIKTQRQVEFSDITTPDYFDLKDAPKMTDIHSCLSTPMMYEGKVIGVINVFTRSRHRFPNDEKRLLQAFASLSAVAAQNADLYARVFNSEDLLRKSERLTTLGLLSAEIGHEIRNPLTVIKLLFGSLGLNYEENDPRKKDTQIIKDKINQLEEIVSKVLSFSKAPESLNSNWSIDELIQDTILLVRLKMQQQRIVLQSVPIGSKVIINGNKGQLQQVFLNLIINASEAMPDGGNMTVSPVIEGEDRRKKVAIYFSDTGIGIPEDIQKHIFESFLTGKSEGTGLGLSITKRILSSHSGDISIAQSSSQGTTLRIELPLAES
jgi:signal transduction histidine kinase